MDNTTNETLTGGTELGSSGGGVAVDSNAVELKDLLKEALGKDFKDNETALKAVKDTFAYVGKAGQEKQQYEQKLAELNAKLSGGASGEEVTKKVAELEGIVKKNSFYAEHPEYKSHKELIESMGSDPSEVVNREVFKEVVKKLSALDESEKAKSVLQSNPRLNVATDKMSKAREALKSGNVHEARATAVSAVIETLEL